jgi:hypothetical protein
VKPETARGLRRLLPRRKRGKSRPDGESGGRPGPPDESFDPVEFAEFLDADEGPLPIDPRFKESLRERLWALVQERAQESEPEPPPTPPMRGSR